MQQLKVENVILIWEAGTNLRAFQTSLTVQEVNFFFTKTQNINLFVLKQSEVTISQRNRRRERRFKIFPKNSTF